MVRSATSVGAQYREAQRAKSNADFLSKVEGSLQELDETSYWLELLEEAGCVNHILGQPVAQKTDELIRIFVTIAENARANGR
jgi:four helix bundle protein